MGKNYTIPEAQRAKIRASVLATLAAKPQLGQAISERQKGKPSLGGHTTNHVRRGISKPETCVFCREQEADRG